MKLQFQRLQLVLLGILIVGLVGGVLAVTRFKLHLVYAETTLTPTKISKGSGESGVGEVPNPLRGGMDQWGNFKAPADYPTPETYYYRMEWRELEPSKGQYTFGILDNLFAKARQQKACAGFRIMAAVDGSVSPSYVPNWSEQGFLDASRTLLTTIANRYKDEPAFCWIEVGFYGKWSEWHTGGAMGGGDMSAAQKQQLIKMHYDIFAPLGKKVIMMTDDSDSFGYAMANFPDMGWRRDCHGYTHMDGVTSKSRWGDLGVNRWKVAPVITETCEMWITSWSGPGGGEGNFQRMYEQVGNYHISAMSGHNMQNYSEMSSSMKTNLVNAYKSGGYRYAINSVSISNRALNGQIDIKTSWNNDGVAPTYFDWIVQYELRNGSSVVWKSDSKVDLKQILSTNNPYMFTDTVSGVPNGTYDLYVKVVDKKSYFDPMNLAILGKSVDGSYKLGSVQVTGVLGGGSNNNGMDGPNLVLNPSFETGSTSWNLEANTAANAVFGQDTITPLVGTYAGEITVGNPQSENGAVVLSQVGFNFADGSTYSFSLGVRSEKPVNGEAEIVSSSGQVLMKMPIFSTSEWKRFNGTFKNSGTNSKSKLVLNFGGVLGSVWLDDVKLNLVSDGGGNSIPTLVPTLPTSPTATIIPITAVPTTTNSWTRCALEREYCSFSGTATVRYGLNGVFVTGVFSNGVQCDTSFFGSDPVAGVRKVCEYQNGGNIIPTTVLPRPTTGSGGTGDNWGLLSNGLRDKYKWPFASNHMANTSIGSGANYYPTGITNRGTYVVLDEELLLLQDTSGWQQYPVYPFQGFGWGDGTNRCARESSNAIDTYPFPQSWIIPGNGENNPFYVLMPDGRTIKQSQPIAHCSVGGDLFSKYKHSNIDIYGTATDGPHGSSSVGGAPLAIKKGELASGKIHHVLGMNLYANHYYQSNCSHVWPAEGVDGYCEGTYGGTNQYLKPGAMIALKPEFNVDGLKTVPGKIIAQAMKDYGAIVADDTAWNSWAIWTAKDQFGSVADEFKQLYPSLGTMRTNDGNNPWYQDMVTIMTNTYVVTNHTQGNFSGGGTRRLPAAPAIGN